MKIWTPKAVQTPAIWKMGKPVPPPTIGVLAKKLHEVEERLAKASGYRIRMVVLSGTQLQGLLPNTNPWSGQNKAE